MTSIQERAITTNQTNHIDAIDAVVDSCMFKLSRISVSPSFLHSPRIHIFRITVHSYLDSCKHLPIMADKLNNAYFEATAVALNQLTEEAANNPEDPKRTLHAPSNHEKSHSWLKRIFPYDSLEAMETAWHMGNYVIDRKTGQKSFEPMSIYVRVGMHALYYGSEQEKALHWKRTVKLLEEQSRKMGKQYDDPSSVDHIVPFIESFDLQESMSEMKEPNPANYKNFNEFFSREIREDARPIDEPDNVRSFSIPCLGYTLTSHRTLSSARQQIAA